MREKAKDIVIGLLAGFVLGGVIEGIAAYAGNIRGGVAGALQWARLAGMVVAIIGIWMLLRELSPISGRRPFYRPDRTPQEMEYVAVREYRAHEKAMREANGEEHRMPQRGKKTALLAMDIGMFLSVLLPDVVLMFLA